MKLDQIILGDAANGLKSVPSDSVDMVLTSPPYDDLRTYGGCGWSPEKFRAIAREIYRVLKPGHGCVWVVGDATINGSEIELTESEGVYSGSFAMPGQASSLVINTGGSSGGNGGADLDKD